MASKPPKAGTMKQTPLAALKLYPGNARRGDVDAIAASLEAHGQYKPIVANARAGGAFGDGTILAGNHTYQAAEQLGWKQIRVFYIDVDDDQAARINLIDNRTNDVAGYDTEALVAQLQALPDLESTGYDEGALQQLLGELADDAKEGEVDPDDVPPIAPSRVDLGDLWQLGDHYLICGDATHPEIVTKLMGTEQAAMVWTDPPYNVDYDGGSKPREPLENDALLSSDFYAMLEKAFALALATTVEGGPIYICHADMGRVVFETAMRTAGWYYAQTLVWVKNRATFGRQDYQWQHEPLLYGWRPGAAHRWFGAFDKTTVVDDEVDPKKMGKADLIDLVRDLRNERLTDVVREDKPSSSEDHPTVKPVELVQRHLRNSSVRGDIVLDPFAGSGTTAIAGEQLGRQARMIELDPAYCDVILTRWEKFTGRKAKIRKSAR